MKRSSSSSHKKSLSKWATFLPYNDNLDKHASASSTTAAAAASKTTTTTTTTTPREEQSEHTIQTKKEESILRTKAYHHVCKHILQRHFDDLIQHHLQENVSLPLSHFMNQFQPNMDIDGVYNEHYNKIHDDCAVDDDDDDPVSSSTSSAVAGPSPKKRRLNNDCNKGISDKNNQVSELIREKLENHIHYNKKDHLENKERRKKKYHPTLLPIGIVHVQPSIIDRKVITHALKCQLIQNSSSLQQTKLQSQEKNQHQISHSQPHYNPAICLLSEIEAFNGGGGIGKSGDDLKNSRVEYYLFAILKQVGRMHIKLSCFIAVINCIIRFVFKYVMNFISNENALITVLFIFPFLFCFSSLHTFEHVVHTTREQSRPISSLAITTIINVKKYHDKYRKNTRMGTKHN